MAGPRLLVGMDDSEGSAHSLRWAERHAARTGGTVRVVTCWQHPMAGWGRGSALSPFTTEDLTSRYGEAQEVFVRDVCGDSDVPMDLAVAEGAAAKILLDEASDADLVIVGTRGRGRVAGALLGSVSRQVAAAAPCPVIVVPTTAPLDLDGSMVVGVDGSTGSRAALRWAAAHATGPIRVVHVLEHPFDPIYDDPAFDWGDPMETGRQLVDTFVAETLGDRPDVTTEVVQGSPRTALLQAAEPGSMIVMGARGASGFDGLLLGSVTTTVLTQADVPVVVLPEPDRN